MNTIAESSLCSGSARDPGQNAQGTSARLAGEDWRSVARWRRGVLSLCVGLQTTMGVYALLQVLPYHGGTSVELAMTAVFALLFCWISVGFWIAMTGFWIRRAGGDPLSLQNRQPTLADETALAPTALVMPIYHEPIERTFAGLREIWRSLQETGRAESMELFILSDSRNTDHWLREQSAWQALCTELGAEGRIHYRRRKINLNLKSGNIGDFLRRWGRKFSYMIVLDADSLMTGEALVRMVALMQSNPRVGILQTSPELCNARSPFARLQQFASRVYGPLFTHGLAFYQLGDAVFWGHNAIIRVQPFMENCGLKRLPGPGLFGGPVFSHDFIESAFMRRAGYEVWLEPALRGSYEESPPSLEDELSRDRRWAKGNLQHLYLLLRARGLRAAHRLALINGIMAYVASPLWLAFLALSTVEATQLTLHPIDYFPEPHRLYPLWPEWNPEWAIALVSSTFFLLFFPKLLAVVDLVLSAPVRNVGRLLSLGLSTLAECLFSALLAPIRMLAHSRYVVEALLGLRLTWAGQNRTQEVGWWQALRGAVFGMVLAGCWAGFAFWLDHAFFYWSLPVALPLLLAAPLSVQLSRLSLGERWQSLGLLTTPWSRIALDLEAINSGESKSAGRDGCCLRPFDAAIILPHRNALHAGLARSSTHGLKLARLQALQRRCLDDGPDALSEAERSLLMQDAGSLQWLHRQVWGSAPGSPWARLIDASAPRNPCTR